MNQHKSCGSDTGQWAETGYKALLIQLIIVIWYIVVIRMCIIAAIKVKIKSYSDLRTIIPPWKIFFILQLQLKHFELWVIYYLFYGVCFIRAAQLMDIWLKVNVWQSILIFNKSWSFHDSSLNVWTNSKTVRSQWDQIKKSSEFTHVRSWIHTLSTFCHK